MSAEALAALAAATGAVAAAVESLLQPMEAVTDLVLQEGNRQRREGFLRCPGCAECADPLPVLVGDA